MEAVSFATYTEVFLTCKRKSADINDIIGIVEAKVGKAQQRAKEKRDKDKAAAKGRR